MYTIGRVPKLILTCKNCAHIEYVSEFNITLGNQRTQAARAMQVHARDQHNAAPLKSLPKNYGVIAKSQW
jgi:hypothetical protein